jgi:3-hydroxyisobutyrate dehydrogenase
MMKLYGKRGSEGGLLYLQIKPCHFGNKNHEDQATVNASQSKPKYMTCKICPSICKVSPLPNGSIRFNQPKLQNSIYQRYQNGLPFSHRTSFIKIICRHDHRQRKLYHMKSIGFVGLGAMGSVMAPLPVKAGFTVTGFDPAAHLDDSFGVATAANLHDLASCNAVVLMLPDGTAVTRVATSLAQAGFAGLLIDMSSSQPDGTIALGKQLDESGIRLIDAPVSGGRKKAALGTLMVMAGGSAADLKAADTLLACFGKVVHVGPLAAGHAMKALNNYVSAAGLLASIKALATAESFGIAPETFTKVINGSTGRNNTTEVKLEPFIISRRYDSGFFLRLMAKDVRIASDLIKNAGFDAPITAALNEYLENAVDHLGEDADHTSLYEMVNPAKS